MTTLRRVAMITKQVDGKPFVDPDDALLIAACAEQGMELVPVPWTTPDLWREFPVLLTRSCWDYIERFEEFRGWLAEVEASGIPIHNHPRIMRWNVSKGYVRDLGTRGAPVPPSVWFEAGGSVPSLAAILVEQGWPKAVVKPLVGVGSKGVFLATDETAASLQEDFAAAIARCGAVVMPYLPAIETIGERSVFFTADEPVHAVRKIPPAGDFRVSGHRVVQHVPIDPIPANLMEAAEKVLRAAREHAWEALGVARDVPPILYARVDLLATTEREDGPVVLNELEIIEPSLYIATGGPAVANKFARLLATGLFHG